MKTVVKELVMTPGSAEKHVMKGSMVVEDVDLNIKPNPLPDVEATVNMTVLDNTVMIHPTHESIFIKKGTKLTANLQAEADPMGRGILAAFD